MIGSCVEIAKYRVLLWVCRDGYKKEKKKRKKNKGRLGLVVGLCLFGPKQKIKKRIEMYVWFIVGFKWPNGSRRPI